jgi:hypothetical protein
MAKVKGIIKGPFNFIDRKGPFHINFKKAEKEQTDETTLEVSRGNVSTGVVITIAGRLYGNEGLEFKMDVYVDDKKINQTPYKPYYDDKGRYIFNYVYGLPS